VHFKKLAVTPKAVDGRNTLTNDLVVNGVRPTVQRQPEGNGIFLRAGKIHAILLKIFEIEPQLPYGAKQRPEGGFFDDLKRDDMVTVKAGNSDAPFHFTKR
jgi:hypothetical protein